MYILMSRLIIIRKLVKRLVTLRYSLCETSHIYALYVEDCSDPYNGCVWCQEKQFPLADPGGLPPPPP